MNNIQLINTPIERDALNEFSPALQEKIRGVERVVLEKYAASIQWMNLTDEQTEEYKKGFTECLTYSIINYPRESPILLTNAKDGGFEYGYELSLVENTMLNAQIQTKTSLGNAFSTYLIEKEESNKDSFVFLYETAAESGVRLIDRIIIMNF